jgi:lipopolysaccharide export system permease protein
MKLLDKYLLREYLGPVAYCLAAFLMVFLIGDLFDHLGDFLNVRPRWPLLVRYYAAIVTPALEYLVPASLLLATLYTLWQKTRANELIAMRAGGVSLVRIMLPFLAVGLLFSIVTGLIKELVVPEAGYWAVTFARDNFVERETDMRLNLVHYHPGGRRLWMIDRLDARHPQRLYGVRIVFEREDGTRAMELVAQQADYMDGHWWLTGARRRAFDEADHPLGALDPPEPDPDAIEELVMLDEQPSDFVHGLREWEFLSVRAMRRYLAAHPALSARTRAQKCFDIHSRMAMPWACLIVTLFGVPAGARSGRQNALTGVFTAVGLFFTFYALNQVGIFAGKRQVLSPWLAAWLSNIVFLAAGLVMTWRMR